MELVYRPVIGAARLLFAFQGLRFTVRGAEHVPHTGGAVMAINHTGFFDFTYAGLAARPSKRVIRFMAKAEVFSHPVAGPLLRGMRHIPVDREAGAASYRAALRALKDGEIVGVFPEATISMSFELKEFKSGAVRMAAATGVPLVPTVIWGSHRVWTKGRKRRLGRSRIPIHIYVGEPIQVRRGEDEAATALLRTRMAELLARAQGAYEDSPAGEDDRWWLPVRLGGTAPSPEDAAALDAEMARKKTERRAAAE